MFLSKWGDVCRFHVDLPRAYDIYLKQHSGKSFIRVGIGVLPHPAG